MDTLSRLTLACHKKVALKAHSCAILAILATLATLAPCLTTQCCDTRGDFEEAQRHEITEDVVLPQVMCHVG
ncbi:hypothetical protein TSMEX_010093 [Taenia solium]|eukprot:TsM_001236500 transcript=TsM_001236500 gene=TsM_001236500